MLSYWEQSSFINYDYIIIGAGIVGLSTAVWLKKTDSKADILVLERGLLPSGASTKNAGFACIGSLSEILSDLENNPEEDVIQLIKLRSSGLQRLRSLLGDANIDYYENGSHELLFENDLNMLNQIDSVNDLLFPIFQKRVFYTADRKMQTFRFGNEVRSIIENKLEGEIHTGKMMRSLIKMTQQLGVQIITGANVQDIIEKNDRIEIGCVNPMSNTTFNFTCSKLGICLNAFSKSLLPEIDLTPGRGLVIITKPIKDLSIKGIFHFDKGYYYFREIDNRILFGGGRNIDLRGESTMEFGFNNMIITDLTNKLQSIILPDTDFEIEHSWSGIMAFGESKMPVIHQFTSNKFAAIRFGGMGIAIGCEAGYQLAELILKK